MEWLSSPNPNNSNNVYGVNQDGSINDNFNVNNDNTAVRPALLLDFSARNFRQVPGVCAEKVKEFYSLSALAGKIFAGSGSNTIGFVPFGLYPCRLFLL